MIKTIIELRILSTQLDLLIKKFPVPAHVSDYPWQYHLLIDLNRDVNKLIHIYSKELASHHIK